MYTADITNKETIEYYKTFKNAVAAMEKKYGSLGEVAVILSKKRVMKDVNAPPELRLQAFDCIAFLGRPKQSLCPSKAAFDACRTYVDGNRWDACALAGKAGIYSAGDPLDRLVRLSGCIPERKRTNSFARLPARPMMTAQCLART